MENLIINNQIPKQRLSPKKSLGTASHISSKQNQVGTVMLYGIPIVSLVIESQERLCLAQISNTLLKQYSYNEIHNRRVALGITCVQCTPVQLEILRRAGAMPVSSRRCGMITRREAERLCKSFLGDNAPPRLPDDFAFSVHHECAWGCRGAFLPSRYNSSRAKCIKCTFCGLFFSPNKFIFHSHRTTPNATYIQPDAANFNSWRRHMKLSGSPPDDVIHAWEDVKAMFNGGTRKRLLSSSSGASSLSGRSSVAASVPGTMTSNLVKQMKLDSSASNSSFPPSVGTPIPEATSPRVPPFSDLAIPISMMDYVWHNGISTDGIKQFSFSPYAVPWFGNPKRSVLGLSSLSSVSQQQESLLQHLCPSNNSEKLYHHSAFRPVFPAFARPEAIASSDIPTSIIKRHLNQDELLIPKKRYSRETDKINNSSFLEFGDAKDTIPGSDILGSRCESVDKENDLRKTSPDGETHDSCSDVLSANATTARGLKITFKKEYVQDVSVDADEILKSPFRSRTKSEPKELIDVSRLLSLKPTLLDESAPGARHFDPNILEAISNLKTEDREPNAAALTKMYQDISGHKERNFDDCKKRKLLPLDEVKSKDESKSESHAGDEEDGDDETVDVETTDDLPTNGSTLCSATENCNVEKIPVKLKEENNMTRTSPVEHEKSKRIWTIARFSLEEPDGDSMIISRPGFSCTNEHAIMYKNRRDVDAIKGSIPEHKKRKVECLSCCQVAFGNG